MAKSHGNVEKKDVIGLAISITALLLSVFTVIEDYFCNPHILKATTELIVDSPGGNLSVDILFLNPGKHCEALKDATFIYSRSDGVEQHHSEGTIGPVVLRPGEIMVRKLVGTSVAKLIRDGVLAADATRVHLQIDFEVIDSSGRIKERVVGITEYIVQNGNVTGTEMRQDDHDDFVDLL